MSVLGRGKGASQRVARVDGFELTIPLLTTTNVVESVVVIVEKEVTVPKTVEVGCKATGQVGVAMVGRASED